MLLVRICLGPARGRFAGGGGFGFRILDFEFVWDFDTGISDFPFWLRPQTALGVRVGRKDAAAIAAMAHLADTGPGQMGGADILYGQWNTRWTVLGC